MTTAELCCSTLRNQTPSDDLMVVTKATSNDFLVYLLESRYVRYYSSIVLGSELIYDNKYSLPWSSCCVDVQ